MIWHTFYVLITFKNFNLFSYTSNKWSVKPVLDKNRTTLHRDEKYLEILIVGITIFSYVLLNGYTGKFDLIDSIL